MPARRHASSTFQLNGTLLPKERPADRKLLKGFLAEMDEESDPVRNEYSHDRNSFLEKI
jgi:hypothetical protein